jgi:hypothetical protein
MSANPKEYNGWSNYETWCVNLWLTNDEGTDRELSRIIRGFRKDEEDANSENDVYGAAKAIKEWVEDEDSGMLPDLGATMAADMLGAAMSEVDWDEIAENHMED